MRISWITNKPQQPSTVSAPLLVKFNVKIQQLPTVTNISDLSLIGLLHKLPHGKFNNYSEFHILLLILIYVSIHYYQQL